MHRSSSHPSATDPQAIPSQRGGFTLIELLVTLGIIILMASTLIVVVAGMIGSGNERATQATVRKLDKMVLERLEAIDRAMKPGNTNRLRQSVSQTEALLNQNPAYADLPDDTKRRLANILIRKRAVREAFPMPNAGSGESPADSSELLYEALTTKTFFDVGPVDTGSFIANEIGDTDGDGKLELIDAWGQPLRFYRSASRLARLEGYDQPDTTEARTVRKIALPEVSEDVISVDPDDPFVLMRYLYTPPERMEDDFHTPGTWHGHLILSAGADGQIGLFEPFDKANLGHLARPLPDTPTDPDPLFDNISNRQKISDGQ